MQDAQPAPEVSQESFSSEPDALFGVCQAIGEDFGFDPFYLRILLLGLLFFSPVGVIGGYLALGAAVALSRLLFPSPHSESDVGSDPLIEEPLVVEEPRVEREPELIAA